MRASEAIVGLAILLGLASWFDWRERRIPNWVCLLVAAAGLSLAVATGGITTLGLNALHLVVALLGGLTLFALRVVGAGDAKLYAATAAWFAVFDGLRLFVSVALAGLVVFIIWFAVRRLQRKPVLRAGDKPEDMLPYGIAISLGGLITAAMNAQLI